MPSIHSFETLRHALRPERAQLVDHALYARLSGLDEVRTFMEHHVFAVWDFMSLLKSLQRALTCVDAPWTPRGDTTARRLINEIVVGEESDDAPGGGFLSHFELYSNAMRQCGASTAAIERFIGLVRGGSSVHDALESSGAPRGSRDFVSSTFATLSTDSLPRIAAAFTLGREELIPDMFLRVVRDVSGRHGEPLTLFVDYLERHIQLDGERHGPMAARMLDSICGDDPAAWSAATDGARNALRARAALWDSIAAQLPAAVA